VGATEIAGLDNDRPTKMQGWTLQDWTQTDGVARVDIAGLDIAGPVWQGWTLQDWTMTDDWLTVAYIACYWCY